MAVHQHWSRIAGPIVLALAGLVVVLFLDARVTYPNSVFMRALWVLWLGLLGWTVWQLSEWRSDWFLATDKRLLLRYGLLTRKVAMMPLSKVTDMSYNRSVPGRVFGYGRFVLESAGQDQALRTIEWVPRPDETYRIICAEIFGVVAEDDLTPGDGATAGGSDGEDGSGDSFGSDGGPPPRSPLPTPISSPLGSVPVSPVEVNPSHSRAIPLHRDPRVTPSGTTSGEIIYSSDGERRRRREAETGPLVGPSGTPPRRRSRWSDDD